MRNHNKLLVFGIAAALLLAIAFFFLWKRGSVVDFAFSQLQGLNVSFHLEGSIHDEAGNPLDNVSIEVERRESTGIGESKSYNTVVMANGHFKIDRSNCCAVDLVFKKDGYYPEKAAFLTPAIPDAGGCNLKNDIAITMRKKGVPVKFVKSEMKLEFFCNGDTKAYMLENEGTWRPLDRIGASALSKINQPCVYAVSERTGESGGIATVQDDINYSAKSSQIAFNLEGSGFILYNGRDIVDGYRDMVKAPDSDYRNIAIDGAIIGNLKSCRPVMFYFKAGNTYGKGCILSAEYLTDDARQSKLRFREYNQEESGCGKLCVKLELLVNPDGTKNLEGWK